MPQNTSPLAMVLTTTSTLEHANEIASQLIHERLAACVQISGPIRSFYRWQGKLECDEEYRLVIKTRVDLWGKLESTLLRLHPYDVPQILMLNVDAASAPYRDWLLQETIEPENE